jgi:hypothetical protein
MLLMPWKIIRSISSSFWLCRLHLFLLIQTLTTINIEDNKISENGAYYLADALKRNTVNIFFLFYPSFAPFHSRTDTNHIRHQQQWNWGRWGPISSWCSEKEYGEYVFLCQWFAHFPSHTGIDHTQRRSEWSGWEWGPISSWCSEK